MDHLSTCRYAWHRTCIPERRPHAPRRCVPAARRSASSLVMGSYGHGDRIVGTFNSVKNPIGSGRIYYDLDLGGNTVIFNVLSDRPYPYDRRDKKDLVYLFNQYNPYGRNWT